MKYKKNGYLGMDLQSIQLPGGCRPMTTLYIGTGDWIRESIYATKANRNSANDIQLLGGGGIFQITLLGNMRLLIPGFR